MSARKSPAAPFVLAAFILVAACYGLTLVNSARKDEVIDEQRATIEMQNDALSKANASMFASMEAMASQNAAIARAEDAINGCLAERPSGVEWPLITTEAIPADALSAEGVATDQLPTSAYYTPVEVAQ